MSAKHKLFSVVTPLLLLILTFTKVGLAKDVNITKHLPRVEFSANGKNYVVERIQDQRHVITGGFARTSRKCPPFCIQPQVPVKGVTPVGELEIIEFMKNQVQNGTGLIVDARTPAWHKKGTIPGSVNIPFTTFENGPFHPQLQKAMKTLGATFKGKQANNTWNDMLKTVGLGGDEGFWDYSNVKEVIFWCNGMWCGQSPHAIRALVNKHRFPVEKIRYYRGGMQSWQILGLTVVIP